TFGDQGRRTKSGKGESERWRDRARTSSGMHGSQTHGQRDSRVEAPKREVWAGNDVCGWWHGRGRDFREHPVKGGRFEWQRQQFPRRRLQAAASLSKIVNLRKSSPPRISLTSIARSLRRQKSLH